MNDHFVPVSGAPSDPGCQVILSMLSEDVSSFQGRYYRLVDAPCSPRPIQRPHPPIVIGGAGPKRTLRAVARFADHWDSPFALDAPDSRGQRGRTGSIEEWRRLRDLLDRYCEEMGRDPATITTSVMLSRDWRRPDELADLAAAWRDAGVDVANIQIKPPCRPDDLAGLAVKLAPLVG